MEKIKPRTMKSMKLKLFQKEKTPELKNVCNENTKHSTSTMKSKLSLNLGPAKEISNADNNAELAQHFPDVNVSEEFSKKYVIINEIGKVKYMS